MHEPLGIDLFCGLGGFSEGLLAEGYRVVGFDIEQHVYGDQRYPGQLVIQDVRTLHGAQFKDAALIVASPPCQAFSWMAMPWSRAKQVARALRGKDQFPDDYKGARTIADLTALFDACFRIQREACEAAGRHIPMVVENVRGAQPWVGRARYNWGSFYLWGDVPALMPMTHRARKFNPDRIDHATKNNGGSWFNIGSPGQKVTGQNPDGRKNAGFRFDGSGKSFQSDSVERHLKAPGGGHVRDGERSTYHLTSPTEGRKAPAGTQWFNDGPRTPESLASMGSKSPARKAASALIAKIPFTLSAHIARCYREAA